jgi:deoxyribonuclease-4
MSLIGVDVSNIRRVINFHNKYKSINFFQCFVSATTNYTDEKYLEILNYIKSNKIYLIVHGSYAINLARRWENNDWWILQFISEINICKTIGSFGIVIHTGKQMELSNAEALNNMYGSLLYVHSQTLDCQNVKILLETPSGQGTETLTNIDEFCRFMNKFYKHPNQNVRERFGVCIDTCHIFAAGMDIRSKSNMNKFFGTIDKLIGIDKIKLCHLNDSLKGLGSKLDRHMTIGKGEIGWESLHRVSQFMKELEIPMILETPSNDIVHDIKLISN